MSQSLSYLIQRLKPYWLSTAVAAMGIELNKFIHFPSNADPAEFYDKDEAGLIDALAATAAGSLVLAPSCAIALTGVITLPDEITFIGRGKMDTIFTEYGFIMGENSYLASMTIDIERSSGGEIIGVENSVTGNSYVEMCDIIIHNTGGGGAVAVAADNALLAGEGDLYIKDCYLYGVDDGVPSRGYGGRSSSGELYVFHSRVYGNTDRFVTL